MKIRGAVEWSIAVFARNEQTRISECLRAIDEAAAGVSALITIIVNGSSDQTMQRAIQTAKTITLPISLYTIKFGCKSNAINVFIHELRPKAELYFFVDASVFVDKQALVVLSRTLLARADLLAVSGIPKNGKSAAQMQRMAEQSAQLFGGMFAVRPAFLDSLVAMKRRIPIGVYRGDGLLSGYMCFETNGMTHPQSIPRVAAVPGAWWRIRPLSALDWRDILAGFNRLVRQAHGRLENQAWNAIIWQCGFSALPKFADEMIKSWLRTARPKRERFLDRFFTYIAIRKIRKSKLPSEQDLRPLKVDF